MRLTPALVERTLGQFEAEAVPENHPSIEELTSLFGDHTFFLDGNGLNVVEPTVTGEQGPEEGQIVKLASWNDANHISLAAHEPKLTDAVVALGSPDSIH